MIAETAAIGEGIRQTIEATARWLAPCGIVSGATQTNLCEGKPVAGELRLR